MNRVDAVITAASSIIFSYILVRKKPKGRHLLEFIALLGFAVPGTVMGIGYILVFNRHPLMLTGTLLIIIINISFREFPVGLEAGISKLHQIDISIEEASRDLGAGSFQTFIRATLPLMSSAFAASFLYTFMVGMITISAVIFLIAPGTNLASLLILRLAETGNIGKASANGGDAYYYRSGEPGAVEIYFKKIKSRNAERLLMMANETILELTNLVKKFGNVVAVNNLSIPYIKRGEFVTFLGPSRCGKTTLLRMIGGFYYPCRAASSSGWLWPAV